MIRSLATAAGSLWIFLSVSVAAGGAPQSATVSDELAQLSNDGWAAVEAQRFGDALAAFASAREQMPEEPSFWLGSGFAAYMLGRNAEATTALEHALSLDPAQTDASRLLGEVYHRTGHLAKAIATYEAALVHAPTAPGFADRLENWQRENQLQDRFYESRGTHFRVLFEGPTDDGLARRIVEILEAAYRNVGGALRAYPSHTITVVLYTREQFHDITRSPAWSAGSYDGQIRIPVQGALNRRGELERVLTHEFVHALVAALGGRMVPVWLNEGLASVFEQGGLARASDVLASAPSRPLLRELHNGFGGRTAAAVSVAYAQSAVAVDRMMDLRGAPAIVLLLKDLAKGVPFASAFRHRIALRYDEFERIARTLR